jgi:ATP-binding cassette subfamily B protein
MFGSFYRSLWTDRYGTPSLIYRLLTEDGRRHLPKYALAAILMSIAAGCTALSAYLIGHVVNQTYLYRNFVAIVELSILTIVIFTVKGFATYGQSILTIQISSEIVAENQQRLFDKLMRESLAYFADRPSSQVMAQVTYGAGAIPGALNLLIGAVGRDGLSLIGLIVVMVSQDPLLSLIGVIVMPPTILFVRNLIGRMRNMAMNQFAAGAGMLETMQETLQGLRIVKAFGLEDEMRRRVSANAQAGKHAGNELARISNRAGPMMEALGGCAIALVFLYGGYRVIETGALPGQFISFIAAFLLAYEPAKRLARLQLDLQLSLTGVRMLYELLDAPPTEPDENDKPPLRVGAGGIEFAAVEFAYRPGEAVIKGMSFVADPGRITALVGPSGGGKTTTFSLLLRFYEVDGGEIRIDGCPIGAISRLSLRAQIAYVGQDVFLFRGSVRENIAVGKPDASDEEIVAAAKAACAHDFIASFPKAYDTAVGEHGMQLSAGERQRVSIARALLKNSPIVLLDEPTSSLDNESERHVRDAIAHLCVGRTTLVIAHRLNTIVHADRIHVVEDGRIVQSGRHEELLRSGGRYADFYNLQLKAETAQRSNLSITSAVGNTAKSAAADPVS